MLKTKITCFLELIIIIIIILLKILKKKKIPKILFVKIGKNNIINFYKKE